MCEWFQFVKVIGLGLMPYFSERWNQFDFVVVSVSLIGLGTQGGFSASILRILRIARLFRVAKSLRGETCRHPSLEMRRASNGIGRKGTRGCTTSRTRVYSEYRHDRERNRGKGCGFFLVSHRHTGMRC